MRRNTICLLVCLQPPLLLFFFIIFFLSGLLFLCCRAAIRRVEPVGSARLIYIPRHLSRVRPKSPKWSAAVSVRQIKPSGKTKQKQRRRLGSHGRQRGGIGGGGGGGGVTSVHQRSTSVSCFWVNKGGVGGKESFIFIEMWIVFCFFVLINVKD